LAAEQRPYVLTNFKNQEDGRPFVGRRDGECRIQSVAWAAQAEICGLKEIEELFRGRFVGPITLAVWVPGMMSSYVRAAFFNMKMKILAQSQLIKVR